MPLKYVIIIMLLALPLPSYAAYDRGKCEACMWLHAKLREDHEKLNPKVRTLGGFKRFSRSEIAAKAVDGWCDGIKEIIYSNAQLPGTEDLRQFTYSDLSTLLAVCKDLQVRYRLNAVSLLSATTSQKNLPLSILCLDDCKKGGRKKFEKTPKDDTPPKKLEIPDDDEITTMKVSKLKSFLRQCGIDVTTVGVTKTDLRNAALKAAATKRAERQQEEAAADLQQPAEGDL
eukprot:TRINITY_DN11784_c1_g1_i1.p1 TRINITY_DN11784_c1_g1~~TRINITY_DN11784_c1_g1_i1.p1  ORF type:complete len:230 (+),score=46.53 TRINITY_DN11784_c1_g1_i1:90-779(+)